MKHLFNATLLLLALLLPANATAHDFEVDGIYYSIMSYTTVKVSGYNSSILDGNIVIPDYVINNYMEYDVVAIADSAFYGSDISSVRISEYITSIGDKAFYGCSKLNDVYSYIANPSQISMGQNVFELYSTNGYQQESPYTNRLLHVPAGSLAAYQSDTNWEPYFEFIVDKDDVTIADFKFEIDNILYTVTSDTTVKVSGQSYWNAFESIDWYIDHLDITIPNHVTNNNIDYTVNEIGELAFFCYEGICVGGDSPEYTAPLSYDITLPETITSIGSQAFGGNVDMVNLTCLATIPPMLSDDVTGSGCFILYVPDEAYPLYDELNNNHPFFDAICIINGEKSNPPIYDVQYLTQPNGLCYGWAVKIFPKKNSVVYTMIATNETGLFDHIYVDSWTRFEGRDSIYYYYEVDNDGGARPDGWTVGFFAIEEGMNPSQTINIGDIGIEGLSYKWTETFNFIADDIAYYNSGNYLEVSYQGYLDPWDGYLEYMVYYSGDVVIPDSVKHKEIRYYDSYDTNLSYQCYDTYVTYPVSAIYWEAFKDCVDLTSVTMPSTITSIEPYAFANCPNLSFIKCLGVTPPNAEYDSFDEGVYNNTTLYVPLNAIEAYRNAEGWENFQNIVGFFDYDFEVDGIYYSMTSDEEAVVVHGEEAYQGNVIIPGTVTYEGTTYTVTGIGGGAFANATVNCLTLPVDVINNIASDAFEGSNIQAIYITGNGAWTAGALPSNIENLYIGSGVTAVPGLQVNPTTIYSYATVPPTCDENSFTGYDAALHVPASSLASYFTAPYWSNFINIVGDAIEPTAVTLDNDSISILIGNQVQLTAMLEPENATPNQILWTSSNANVATVNDGLVQAIGVGECDIKASLLDKSAVCHVTVTEIAPTEVTLNQTFAKLEIGSQLSLTATVLPDDATDKVITWATTNSAVATVDNLGNVIAVGPGECSITASCRDKQATCHVIVVEHLIFITLDQHELSVLPNHIEMLTPNVSPVSTDLRVTSSDPAVAAARLANGKIQVVGITEGTTTITIGSVDGYAEPDSCVVTVYTERGDVNNDGYVNITDAIDLINEILNDASASFYTENADCNNDGEVNISDVMRLINYILSGAELEPKETTDPTPAETETITVNGVSFTMVRVEGGSFMMGCTPEQNSEAGSNEAPVHRVTLSTYYMGQTEVTQELWQAVMGSNPSNFATDSQNPVEKVSWNDCQEFISQLNQLTGKTFRLPTEAEWEFAACGGNKSHGYTYSGSNDINEIAWFSDNSENTTHPVGLKKANELGLFDMTGNVYEWCYDRYGYYPEAQQTDPQGPETGSSKIYRGGGWLSTATTCRNTRRNYFAPGVIRNFMGLRLVMVP